MTSIPAATSRVYRSNFKRHYLRKKDFFWFFIAFLKCAWNLEPFLKNDKYPSLTVSEVIDAERRGYLHVQKFLLQNTIR